MKLTAQRVMQPATKAVAINAFEYLDGSYVWNGARPAALGQGRLHNANLELTPVGGNHVLTYLDISAPDEVSNGTIRRAFAELYGSSPPPPFHTTVGNCTFDSKMIRAYQLGWRQEIIRLFEAALAVRAAIP